MNTLDVEKVTKHEYKNYQNFILQTICELSKTKIPKLPEPFKLYFPFSITYFKVFFPYVLFIIFDLKY